MMELLLTPNRITPVSPVAVNKIAAYLLNCQPAYRRAYTENTEGILNRAITQQRMWRERYGFGRTPVGDFICAGLIVATIAAEEFDVPTPLQMPERLVVSQIEVPEHAMLLTVDLDVLPQHSSSAA